MSINVSVVVPVYNVEKYLERCLLSLVGQTLEGIEIIIVNDGSPDNSQAIIDSFSDKYPDKVIALSQENMGLGPARNTGVRHARGEYVGFVDSDDYVDPDMFKILYDTAKRDNCDVVLCDFFVVDEVSGDVRVENFLEKNRGMQHSIEHFVLTSTNPSIAWNKLYKKHLLEDTPYPAGWYEDLATTPVIISNCRKISVVSKPLYYYISRENSITSQRSNPKNLDVLGGWLRSLTHCNPKYKSEVAYAVYFSICFYLDFRCEHRDDYIRFFKDNENFFKDNFYLGRALSAGSLPDLFAL